MPCRIQERGKKNIYRNEKNNVGRLGEAIAKQFLESLGYQFLEANFACPAGEIDLIFQHEQQTVFVEVKTRNRNNDVAPNTELPEAKLLRLQKAAELYVARTGIEDWRFELVAVTLLDQGKAKVKRIPL